MSVESVFSQFPVLTTERLVLRKLQSTDKEALFEIKSNGDVTKHYGQEPHESINDSHSWIQRLQLSYRQRLDVAWCVTLKGEDRLIGVITLWNLDSRYQHGEIGYELHPAYGKRGIMHEAVAAVITFAFTEFGLHRIEACPFDDNPASKNLLVKLGFVYEGTLRERHFFRDHYKDQLYFRLLKDEWLKPE
jgi:ribosomal-protein-alanine N-acetyltransferase